MAMIHPLLRLAVQEPHLLAEHVKAYATLAGEDVSKISSSLALKGGLYAGAGILAMLGLILVGVALLLVGATSSVDHTTWALIVVPLTPFVLAGVLVLVARSSPT
ncbi:MAG: phage holin family protein, partial [Pseudomonadota bacterium]|nr:phage holin family protein [Pseudomonadota bacterium]